MTQNRDLSHAALFAPFQLGPIRLANRIAMAPMSRNRADVDDTPHALTAQYYEQRASAGLIVTEAAPISLQGRSTPNMPGIYCERQVAGWKNLIRAVHGAGGKIFLQLWHAGRVSHPSFQPNNALPVAPSAIEDGRADLVSFGALFIGNPDLVRRLRIGAPLNAPDRSTFYGGDQRGYTDYPSLVETELDQRP